VNPGKFIFGAIVVALGVYYFLFAHRAQAHFERLIARLPPTGKWLPTYGYSPAQQYWQVVMSRLVGAVATILGLSIMIGSF
jgi:type II secretory pathway component PulF